MSGKLGSLTVRKFHDGVVIDKVNILSPDQIEEKYGKRVREEYFTANGGWRIYSYGDKDQEFKVGTSHFQSDLEKFQPGRFSLDAFKKIENKLKNCSERFDSICAEFEVDKDVRSETIIV